MGVDLTDSRDAQARGWGPPPTPSSYLVDVHAGGVSVPVRAEIADLVAYCLDQTVARGYHLHKDECWGYSPRHILNDPSKPWSNHAWGLAVDLNATENPYGSRGDFPKVIAHKLWNTWGFRWGGDYQHSPRDDMHFEYMGSPDDAHHMARRLGNGHGLPAHHRRAPKPPPYPGHLLERGSHGQPVGLVQRALKVHVDRLFGPLTEQAVRQFQRSHRLLHVDGVVGPATWKAIFG